MDATINWLGLVQEVLQNKSQELRSFINHGLSIGLQAEKIILNFISNYVPGNCEVVTGFALAPNGRQSRQGDIVIFDKINFPPWFKENEFAVLNPMSVKAVIEVKTKIDQKRFFESVRISESFKDLREGIKTFLFVFEPPKKHTTIGNWINSDLPRFTSNGFFDHLCFLGKSNVIKGNGNNLHHLITTKDSLYWFYYYCLSALYPDKIGLANCFRDGMKSSKYYEYHL